MTTYGYDSQNRPISITRNNVESTILYGDPKHIYTTTEPEVNHIFYVTPSLTIPGQGEIIIYPPVLNTNFTATRYEYSQAFKIYYPAPLRNFLYAFDGSGRLISYSDRSNNTSDINVYNYTYSDDNITNEQAGLSAGHGGVYNYIYTYDDKVNPFYDLWDPQVNPRLQFSRNNTTSISVQGQATITYTYEYNQQGLPTKRTGTQNGIQISVLTFTYESF
ncbi:hypothetical protein [Spirosoma telluris]|uniref:hypothetical protein n=1 Tax=Spirosoma telluris TaxID=2183553 RepID=UPI001314E93A